MTASEGWADYSAYATAGDETGGFAVGIGDAEFRAAGLSTCGTTLVVDVPAAANVCLPADEPVRLSTPEETVRARLCSVTVDVGRTTLSFERIDR